MPSHPPSTDPQRLDEVEALRERLAEADAALRAIREGDLDALVVSSAHGQKLLAIEGATEPYRHLIERMSEGALTLSPEGLVLYANRRFADMLRTPLEKVIGSEIRAWFPPERRQVLETLLRKDEIGKRSEELTLAAADGTQVPVYVSVNHLWAEAGRESLSMVATDLTAQKRGEAMLADEKLASAILEQAADAIVICDETGRILRASRQAQAFYDGDLIGQHFQRAFPLRRLDGTAIAPFDSSLRHPVEARLERNGQWFDYLFSVGHLKGARSEVLGSVVTLTDITESKRAAEALRGSMEEFRALAEAMPQIVWITRADGWNIYCNRHWMEYTGLTLEESMGHGWNSPFHPDDRQLAWDAWQHATATIGTYAIESRLRRADGVYRWWLIRGRPLQDATGNVLKWFGTCTDIHDLKVAELEITRANRALLANEIRIKYMNRVYAMLSGINTLIVRVRDRDELFRGACRIAVEEGGFRTTWVGIADRSAMRIVPVASAGGDCESLAAGYADIPSSEAASLATTMTARAFMEKKPVVSNDTQSEPGVLLGTKHVEPGIRSVAILPLIVSDQAVGVLSLYASEIDFFHEEEMKLLTELAGDVSFAIDHIEKQERLDYLAYYDVLTGLANRKLFLERLAQYMRSAASGGHPLALFLFDLERFKSINDSLGRTAGDALLKQVAEWLTLNLGDANLFARVDADRFAIVLPAVKQGRDVARLIEKAIGTFMEHPFRLNDAVFRIGAKVGAAVFPDDGTDADTLFKNAEAALKEAKANGERYLVYTQRMTATVAGNLSLENQLRRALDNEEFVLHYQPKVNLATGKLAGAEALIRWNDPRTGLVPPARFIPVLEEIGLIQEVGRWALRQAIADHLHWRTKTLAPVRVAVNVSPLQLRNRGFIAEIEQLIGAHKNAAAGLELEITESVIMADVKLSIASLQAIRAMGVRVAIDDFGTGFSSLSYLSKLPVDTLKIDRSFVSDLAATPEGLALVAIIIDLGHSQNLTVVAEGVETEEQLRLLRLLNCDEMQGFLFSRPIPSASFEEKFLSATAEIATVMNG